MCFQVANFKTHFFIFFLNMKFLEQASPYTNSMQNLSPCVAVGHHAYYPTKHRIGSAAICNILTLITLTSQIFKTFSNYLKIKI